MNYTGIVDEYYVTNVESGVEEKVANQTEYELLKKLKRLYKSKNWSNTV